MTSGLTDTHSTATIGVATTLDSLIDGLGVVMGEEVCEEFGVVFVLGFEIFDTFDTICRSSKISEYSVV